MLKEMGVARAVHGTGFYVRSRAREIAQRVRAAGEGVGPLQLRQDTYTASEGARMTHRGQLQVYTGDGKGKTTAALGLVVRAVGAGLRVHVLQFIKSMVYAELKMLERLGVPVSHALP